MIKHREVWDAQHYQFKRTSGLQAHDFAESSSKWDRVVGVVAIILAVCVLLLEYGHAFN